MGQKLIISSDFMYFSNILTLPFIICVVKQSGSLKSHHGISVKWSQYRDSGPADPPLVYKISFCVCLFTFGHVDFIFDTCELWK